MAALGPRPEAPVASPVEMVMSHQGEQTTQREGSRQKNNDWIDTALHGDRD